MPDIRKIEINDLEHLKSVIDSNGLFPSDLLDEMTNDYFSNEKTTDIWLTKEIDSIPAAVVYCAPERMTEGTFNLYLIAISKNLQGKGISSEMMAYLENFLRENGNRILLVETSSLPEFELTRKFYDELGYKREAVIREFYQEGEDKVVFWKKL
ncbi:MAG: GNAT family N-acetyltransferase [Saprospiraceae bacterium]|nr:GNAT family N-acetyltransferase [Candidatus Opimibacter iunctus]